MTLADKQAAEALVALLEAMRERGQKSGQIVIIVENGRPTWAKIAEYAKTVEIKTVLAISHKA